MTFPEDPAPRPLGAPAIFLDTETTGLNLTDDIWEFAAIRRELNGREDTLHLFIEHDPAKVVAMPARFRDDLTARYDPDRAVERGVAAHLINAFTRAKPDGPRPHIVGCVPNFDTERLALLLRAHGLTPGWHYHLIDVEALAVGYLAGVGVHSVLPWDSDELSSAVGVHVPVADRHTAMGDARWARALFDRITGRAACQP